MSKKLLHKTKIRNLIEQKKALKQVRDVATANKIATIYYKMVRNKVEFIPVHQTKYQAKRIAYMERKWQTSKVR